MLFIPTFVCRCPRSLVKQSFAAPGQNLSDGFQLTWLRQAFWLISRSSDFGESVRLTSGVSLRSRLLLPLVLVSIVASVVVAMTSYILARHRLEQNVNARFASIDDLVRTNSFPLNRSVLASIAALTNTEVTTATIDGAPLESTFADKQAATTTADGRRPMGSSSAGEFYFVTRGDRSYRVRELVRQGTANVASNMSDPRGPTVVSVWFLEQELRAELWRAALPPLVTGLSTILLLATITLSLTSRLVGRLKRLQGQVQQIADGNFGATYRAEQSGDDEVSRLALAINSMSAQLGQMWDALHQREGERLLHQIASGLAHNLRNHMTGARMAVELHRRKCHQAETDEGLALAIHEIEQTESYIRRLLLISSTKPLGEQPASVADCLRDVASSVAPTAKHRGIALNWHTDAQAGTIQVVDGPSFILAISNLLLNSIHVATQIDVVTAIHHHDVRVDVIDDGPGPPAEISEQLFEPFVTSRAEGLGLGLPLVRKAMQRLGGNVEWKRDSNKTIFSITMAIK